MKFIKTLLLCSLTFSLSSFASSRSLDWRAHFDGSAEIENADGSWTYMRSIGEIILEKSSIALAAEDASNIPWLESHIQTLQTESAADREFNRRCNLSPGISAAWSVEVFDAIEIGKKKLEKIKNKEKQLEQARIQTAAQKQKQKELNSPRLQGVRDAAQKFLQEHPNVNMNDIAAALTQKQKSSGSK